MKSATQSSPHRADNDVVAIAGEAAIGAPLMVNHKRQHMVAQTGMECGSDPDTKRNMRGEVIE